jgi:hypothetical protein
MLTWFSSTPATKPGRTCEWNNAGCATTESVAGDGRTGRDCSRSKSYPYLGSQCARHAGPHASESIVGQYDSRRSCAGSSGTPYRSSAARECAENSDATQPAMATRFAKGPWSATGSGVQYPSSHASSRFPVRVPAPVYARLTGEIESDRTDQQHAVRPPKLAAAAGRLGIVFAYGSEHAHPE